MPNRTGGDGASGSARLGLERDGGAGGLPFPNTARRNPFWTTGPFAGTVRVEVEVPVSARRSIGKGAATVTFLPGGERSQVLFLQVGARDAYGSGIEGIAEVLRLMAGDRQIARGNPSGPADLISPEEFDFLDWWTYDGCVNALLWARGFM